MKTTAMFRSISSALTYLALLCMRDGGKRLFWTVEWRDLDLVEAVATELHHDVFVVVEGEGGWVG